MDAPEHQRCRSVSHRLRRWPHTVLGPLFWGWFKARTHEQCEWRYPTGPAEINIAGTCPARILVIGDGPAAGCGVRSHQLGIAGHLGRHLFSHIQRGVVVTVAAQPAASARSTRKCLGDLDIEGYDSIVLMLATTDAFCLTSRRSWRRNMTGLVHALKSTKASSVFVTTTASVHLARRLTPFARRMTGRHARALNVETSRICAQTNTPLIQLDAASDLTSRTYAKWGRRIGTHVARSLQKGDAATAFQT
ncbi:hypothetical protein [Leifsonia sp. Root4]|uniref:hypothetical protein n=1 Tax=Leifsonia sp. Root4 TaxID=1736525 RepID=UPI0012F889CC|nr:hypothetical protein [Leifsonia sp. Root4]